VRALELLDEVATHLPEEMRLAKPQVPWRMIVATRNRLIHGYLGSDDDPLWDIARDESPRHRTYCVWWTRARATLAGSPRTIPDHAMPSGQPV